MDSAAALLPVAPTVDALARLARGRDSRAWALVVERHGPGMLRLARRLCGDAALADDAVQEALLHVRDGAARFRPAAGDAEAAAAGWVLRITANCALHLLRARRRREHHERQAPGPAAGDEPSAADARQLADLRAAIAELPEHLRSALVLHHCAGLDFASVGAQLGISPGNARVRAHRALARLRGRLAGAVAAGLAGLACPLAAAAPLPAVAPAWSALLASSTIPAVPASAVFTGSPTMATIGLGAALALTATCAAVLHLAPAGEPAPHPAPAPAAAEAPSGRVRGEVLRLEDGTWLVIRNAATGGEERFLPHWRGGMPKDGGGLDQAMLARVRALRIGSQVEVAWEFEERRRVVGVDVLVAGGGAVAGGGGAVAGGGDARPAPVAPAADLPAGERAGTVRGTVVRVEGARLVVRGGDGAEHAFTPHWRGGLPKDGGRLDPEMSARIAALRPGQRVEVQWEFEERPRAVRISALAGGEF